MLTIDQAINQLIDRLKGQGDQPPLKTIQDYVQARDQLIGSWPNRIELITHPNEKMRKIFKDIIKQGEE